MKRLALGLVVLAACSQSYTDGVRAICEAPVHVGSIADPAHKAVALAKWMTDHVHNADVRHELAAMATTGPNHADALRAMLKKAGIAEQDCPMLGVWSQGPTGRPARSP